MNWYETRPHAAMEATAAAFTRPSKGPIALVRWSEARFPRQKANKALISGIISVRQHYEKRLFLALRISKKKAEFFLAFFFLSLQTLSKHFGKQVFHTVYTLVATENESRQTKKDEFHWRKWNVNLCRILSRPSRPRANQTYSIYFLSPPPSRFFLESSEMLVLLLF